MTTISFPGLGIPEFSINPIAIPIGKEGIRWYALLIVTGMIIAVLYAWRRNKAEGISFDTLIDFALFTIPVGIVGARLYYVFFHWLAHPENYKSFLDVIAIWNGGLAIYGGIIFGIITIFVVAKVKKMSWKTLSKFFDSIAPGVMIAQALGRWGNFCNGEAYGSVTSLPWRMCSNNFAKELLSQKMIESEQYYKMLSPNTFKKLFEGGAINEEFYNERLSEANSLGVHPTFLYESLWNVIGFILINLVYKKKRFDGQIALMYIAWYGLGRTFIELLRTDSLTNGGSIRVSSVLGLASFLVAGTLLVVLFIKNRHNRTYGDSVALAAAAGEIVEEATEETAEVITEADTEATEENADESPQSTEASESIDTQENQESKEEDDDGKVD